MPTVLREYLAGLGFEVDEADRAGGLVGAGVEFGFKPVEVFDQFHLEAQGVGRTALAASAIDVRPVNLLGRENRLQPKPPSRSANVHIAHCCRC